MKSSANTMAPLPSPGHASCVPSHPSYYKQQQQQEACNLELLNLDKIKLSKPTSPSLSDAAAASPAAASSSLVAPIKNFPSSDNIGMLTHSSRGSNESRKPKSKSHHSQDSRSVGSLRHNTSSLVRFFYILCTGVRTFCIY